MPRYVHQVFPYRRPPEFAREGTRHPVVVVGAGPVGLVAAIDLAQRGHKPIVLDEDSRVSTGSRAICYAKRTLEILDRLGCAESVVAKGVQWSVGRVFFRDALAYRFDLLAERGHRRPAFVNLQQYYFEHYLVERARELGVDVRWQQKVVGVRPGHMGAGLDIETPEGGYRIDADWLVVADGARSGVRGLLGLDTEGQVFRDRFLIVDIRMTSSFPTERWFWFDPPFHPGQSVLLHRQGDDIWRIDFQLGWDADPELEKSAQRIIPRLRAMLGPDAQFELEWASVYTFQCRRMQHFRHERVIFCGDAAHVVSPFGARGANSGVQDADNLAWKLDFVIRGIAPERLIDTYDHERVLAADENILQSTRSTDFITPKSAISRVFRDAVLELARDHAFARRLVNSGRLSVPAVHASSPLSTPDVDGEFATGRNAMVPGTPALDAPVHGSCGSWLLEYIGGEFTLLTFGATIDATDAQRLAEGAIPLRIVQVGGAAVAGVVRIEDHEGLLARRYDAHENTCYLFRPDQHVCARWRKPEVARIEAAIARATANDRLF